MSMDHTYGRRCLAALAINSVDEDGDEIPENFENLLVFVFLIP